MEQLDFLARKYGTDKRTNDSGQNIYHGYTVIYDDILKNQKNKYKNILEIGVQAGKSIKMWEEYFPNAIIWGIDNFSDIGCTVKKEDIETDRIKIIVGDQSDKKLIDDNFKNIRFDMIADDGSHFSWHQQKSLDYLWNYLKSGGFYFIEDLAVCYNRKFREFDDERSSTLKWLELMQNHLPFSYYIEYERMSEIINQIESINVIGELGIIKKL